MKTNCLLIVLLLCLFSCQSEEASSSANTTANSAGNVAKNKVSAAKANAKVKATNGNTENGVSYEIFKSGNEQKADFGLHLTMNLSYATTPKDSVIFSSFKRAKPLSIRFTETLFNGALNDAFKLLAPGDSAVFMVPAEKIYARMPSFVKKGDQLKYIVKMISIDKQAQNQPPKVTGKRKG